MILTDMKNEEKMMEVKVRLHHIDSGQCQEVWEMQTAEGKPACYLVRIW